MTFEKKRVCRGMDARCFAFAAALLATGCGAGAQKEVVNATLDATNANQRRETFEATARVLDENPQYVDEFYAVAVKHPAMFRRFFADAARDLKDPELAKMTAEIFVKEPESLEQVLLQTTDLAQKEAPARQAIAVAVEKRAETMADIITDRPSALVAMLNATTKRVEAKPKSQPPFLDALQQSAPRLVNILKENPKAMGAMTKSMLKASVKDKPVLDDMLAKLGLTE